MANIPDDERPPVSEDREGGPFRDAHGNVHRPTQGPDLQNEDDQHHRGEHHHTRHPTGGHQQGRNAEGDLLHQSEHRGGRDHPISAASPEDEDDACDEEPAGAVSEGASR